MTAKSYPGARRAFASAAEYELKASVSVGRMERKVWPSRKSLYAVSSGLERPTPEAADALNTEYTLNNGQKE
jgi:hypothetical protein